MRKNKIALLCNLSNEANMCSAEKTRLFQLNLAVLIGMERFREDTGGQKLIPLALALSREGELTVRGLDGVTIADEHIRVYSDRKVTTSENEARAGREGAENYVR